MENEYIATSSSGFTISPVMIWFVAFLLFLLFLRVGLIFLRKWLVKGNRIPAALRQKVFMVTVPRDSLKDQDKQATPQMIQEEIGTRENLFSILGSLIAQRGLKPWLYGRTDNFSFEIVVEKGQVFFYVAAPDYLAESLKQQLLAVYPYAQIEEVVDYNLFSPQGAVVGGYLKLAKEYIYPLKTYKKMEGLDPLEGLINPLTKVEKGEGAAIQFVIRSAYKGWRKKGVRMARYIQQGKTIQQAFRKAGIGNFFDKTFNAFSYLGTFFSSQKTEKKNLDRPEAQYKLSPMEQEVVKGIEEKSSKAGFDVNIRIVSSAASKESALNNLNNIVNSFGEFNVYQYGNILYKVGSANLPRLISDFIHRAYNQKYRLVLGSEEMTSLWHLPLPHTQAPNIRWLEARKAQPPVNLPKDGIILGENVYRDTVTQIRIKEVDRQRHVYIIGKSGTGKSVLMENMIIQDMQNGEGVCLIDPHGDSINVVLEHVPPERAEDVILFDPADYERPIGINLLEFQDPEQKTFVINEMIKIFDKLYDLKTTGGPMFEQYMRNAMLLMMEDTESGSTLLEVPKVLADASFRKYKLSKCQNPVVRDFWEKEAEKAGGEASLANMVPYITSKLTPFISSDLLRPIIAQQKSAFNFREAMDTRKIILIKLSKGVIGELSCNLLGMVIVGKILMAALSRVNIPEKERKNFYLYIDEFQNFTTDTISVILSEARKYRLCLNIAHQYINQLIKNNDTSIRDSVFGNAGTFIAFRIGPDDAEIVAKQFAPVFNEYDVINVPKFNAYIKLLIDNQNPPAFNFRPTQPQTGDKALAGRIKELSRLKYGRERNVVEKEILERIRIPLQKPIL